MNAALKLHVLVGLVGALLFASVALAKPAAPAKVCRSAVTGKVVTPAYAAANPATTICARRKSANRR